jgi:hypothetical protein
MFPAHSSRLPLVTARLVCSVTKVLHMKISDCQNIWRLCEVWADFFPNLSPTVKCTSHETKCIFRHQFMLQVQVGLNQRDTFPEPILKVPSRLRDLHQHSSPKLIKRYFGIYSGPYAIYSRRVPPGASMTLIVYETTVQFPQTRRLQLERHIELRETVRYH